MASEPTPTDGVHRELRPRYQAALRGARDTLRATTDGQRAARQPSAQTLSVHPPAPSVPDDELCRLRQEIDDLRQALATRDLIWLAKTIIASTTGADPDEAHRLLVRQSQHENRKLREVAAEIVDRHQREAS